MINTRGLLYLLLASSVCANTSLALATQKTSCPSMPLKTAAEKPLDSYPSIVASLQQEANQALHIAPLPIETLISAGVTDKKDPRLQTTRAAFRQADETAIAALAYYVLQSAKYLEYTRHSLLEWATINKPTGHPINETRLEGLIWAFMLICSDLSITEQTRVTDYFEKMRAAKRAWKFGPETTSNNHKTHQLKMLLLLDKALQDSNAFIKDSQVAREHSERNLKPSGISIDYVKRDSLFYHVYNLEAWLEISLVSKCCDDSVDHAFWFAARKLMSNDIHNEFVNSRADIDKKRAQAGFKYASGDYNPKRAFRSVQVYATLHPDTDLPNQLLDKVGRSNKHPSNTFVTIRRLLWKA